MSLEFDIELENAEEVQRTLENIPAKMKFSLFDSMMILAQREENLFKATTGFRDRTGHLRRSLFVTAVLDPLGIEIGAIARYAPYVAFPHGTWLGGFWENYLVEGVPRMLDFIEQSLKRFADRFNIEHKEEGE